MVVPLCSMREFSRQRGWGPSGIKTVPLGVNPAQVAALKTGAHPGLFLAGSAAGAFGLPDCIRSGEDAAERAAAFLSTGQRAPEPSAGLPRSSAWVAYQANQNA